MVAIAKQINVDVIPAVLRERRQWVCWRIVMRKGKPDKLPFQPDGTEAKSNDFSTWHSFSDVLTAYRTDGFDGIGFVFSDYDDFAGIDLDGCRNPDTGEIAEWAQAILSETTSYCEISPSSTGFKLYGIGRNPLPKGKNWKLPNEPEITREKKPGIELYSTRRYFCVTGEHVEGFPATLERIQPTIDSLCDRFVPGWRGETKPASQDGQHHNRAADGSVVERARKYLEKCAPAISGQGGHNNTFSIACKLVLGFELSPDEAFPLLAEWNQRCEPPWSEHEMRHKLDDASKEPGERGHLRDAGRPPGGQHTGKPNANRDRGQAHALLRINSKSEDLAVPTDEDLANWTPEGPVPGSNGRAGNYSELKVTRMIDVGSEQVRWLWKGWFAFGKCHLLVGMPGIGKSFATTSFAATITTGGIWPDGTQCDTPGEVLLLSGEDGKEDTIRPRLDAHGADAAKVYHLDGQQVQDDDGKVVERGIRLDVDLHDIDQYLTDHPDIRIWFIDPLSEFLGKADSHRDTDVRQILGPLSGLAEKHQIAIVFVTHFNKSNMGPALYKAMGSLAFVAQSRVAFGFIRDHEDEDRVLVLPLKNNIHRKVPGRAYRIIDGRVEWEQDGVHITADEAMEPPKQARTDKRAEAVEWLNQRLSGDCVDSDTLESDALNAGISKSTLWRARKEIGVVSTKSRLESHGKWFVSLPQTTEQEDLGF